MPNQPQAAAARALAATLAPVLVSFGWDGATLDELHEALRERHGYTGNRLGVAAALGYAAVDNNATQPVPHGRYYAPRYAPAPTE